MKYITAEELRIATIACGTKEYSLPQGASLTPLAVDYANCNSIALITDGGDKNSKVKPEHMTYLCGNVLVNKAHPRIIFRGKLDVFASEIISMQLYAQERGELGLVQDLDEILKYSGDIMSAEVKNKTLTAINLLGLDSEELRRISHNVKKEIGISHPVMNYNLGGIVTGLNRLRTIVRECELCAVAAFLTEQGDCSRTDIVEALNRLSSTIYIMICRFIAKKDIAYVSITSKKFNDCTQTENINHFNDELITKIADEVLARLYAIRENVTESTASNDCAPIASYTEIGLITASIAQQIVMATVDGPIVFNKGTIITPLAKDLFNKNSLDYTFKV